VETLSRANIGLAKAFDKCIANFATGFEYFIETTPNQAQFVFHAKYSPVADGVNPVVKQLSIEPGSVAKSCSGIARFATGKTLGLDEQLTCSRDPHQQVTISLVDFCPSQTWSWRSDFAGTR